MTILKFAILLWICQFISGVISKLGEDVLLESKVRCLDKSFRYRKRPNSNMKIMTELAIMSIDSISSAKMELSADVYLIHEWIDRRCSWSAIPGQGSVLTLYARPSEGPTWTHEGLNNLWQPDTHVLNAKRLSRPETVTHIYATGGIVKSRTRLSMTTSCPMDLMLYPMDRQVCQIIFQSSAHPSNELTYIWKNQTKLTFIQGFKHQEKMIPDFRLLGYKLELVDRLDELSMKNFTQFVINLYLERPLGFFIWEVYMPATFIVLMSFTSFWLDRGATPARVSLGVTTVLTMTTLLSSANKNLPHTAYPKSIGVFLAGCFFFTFMAMMEYAVASYMERRKSTRRLIKQISREQNQEQVLVKKVAGRRNTVANLMISVRPASVDVYSRILFPLAFMMFFGIYWIVLSFKLETLPDDIVHLHHT